MRRDLSTLIEQFSRANEMDRYFEFEGEPYWLEVDGVRTRMADAWLADLLPEEKIALELWLGNVKYQY